MVQFYKLQADPVGRKPFSPFGWLSTRKCQSIVMYCIPNTCQRFLLLFFCNWIKFFSGLRKSRRAILGPMGEAGTVITEKISPLHEASQQDQPCPEMIFPRWLFSALSKQIPKKSMEWAHPSPSSEHHWCSRIYYNFPLCSQSLVLSNQEWFKDISSTNHFVMQFPSIMLDILPKFCPWFSFCQHSNTDPNCYYQFHKTFKNNTFC